jgi:carnitine-CoA ligase
LRIWTDVYEVRIADEEGEEVAVGDSGEILVRSTEPGVIMGGYFGMPEASLDAFRDLWFHTGDVGKVDGEGWLYYLGRKGDLIRHRGENVSPWEVEEVVNSHPSVAECAAVGVPSPLGEQDVLVVASLAAGATLTTDELASFCAGRMARFMIPDRFVFIDQLPHTPTGKVARAALRERFASSGHAVTATEADNLQSGR